MHFTYDSQADAMYFYLREPEAGERACHRLDEQRIVDVDGAGKITGYEFLFVSRGVSLDGIDEDDAARIREAVSSLQQLAVA